VAHNTLEWLSYELRVSTDTLLELEANAETHYITFEKKFKNGKVRPIECPDDRLMPVLTAIRKNLLLPIPLSPIVHGCVKGRSPLSNARVLVKASSVASVDVKHFFPSVTNRMVYRVCLTQVGVGPDVARTLTRLTTRKGHLPQGSPTSDALANLVLAGVDRRVEQIAAALSLRVVRYVDNYDFAGARAREAIGPTIAALQRAGFAVRHKKTFNSGPRAAHVVTGLGVNSSLPKVPRPVLEAARVAVIGLLAAREAGADTRKMERSIRGRLIHISQTNPQFVVRMKRHLAAGGLYL
jgi:RNA-directed DNA polymerase